MKLTGAQIDRAAGVLLCMACGDALGAGYEFGPPMADDAAVGMVGGGTFGWAPGEWTDDTSMAVPIAEIAARGDDLRSAAAHDELAAAWSEWAAHAPDVGNQTRAVLSAVRTDPTGEALTAAAQAHHQRNGRSGGNGSLMRTAPVALAYLDDPDGLIEAARGISALTHFDPQAGDACALWCLAIRHAVLTGELDVRAGLEHFDSATAADWSRLLDDAEARPPASFTRNGWVVEALQGAWSAIHHTAIPVNDPATDSYPAQHLQHALEAAVRGGNDTDTVAAIAGALLGAAWGASAVPAGWRRIVHGWPGLHGRDLIRLGVLAARKGANDRDGWPSGDVFDYSSYGETGVLVPHPHDPGVLLAGVGALDDLPVGVDAVVSLCRLGAAEVPATGVDPANHVEVWLIDKSESSANPHLDFVLADAAEVVAALRAEGRTVLLHCVQAQSRTPTVAALYAARHLGINAEEALRDTCSALPNAHPNAAFRAALRRVSGLAAEGAV